MTDTMNTEKLKWYVEEYVGLGLKVLPVWGIKNQNGKYFCACPKGEHCDQKPGKHPLSVGKFISGVHTASDDIEALHAAIDLHPGMNLAIAVPDGMVVVDVDPRNGGDYQLQDIEAKHGKFPDTWDQLTGGGGRHLCYQVPQGLKFAGKLAPGIDIKQAGGYIMVEPSLHESGRTYDWEASSSPLDGISIETAPDWLLAMANRPTITSVSRAMATYSVDEVAMADLRSALTCVDPDDRDTWVRMGHALKTIGDAGLDIWDQWSQRSPKYKASEIVYRWNGFAPKDITYKTVFHIAQEHGWTNTAKLRSKTPEPSTIINVEHQAPKPAKDGAASYDVPDYPQYLLKPGGDQFNIVKAISEWILESAQKPQPTLALAAALSVVGTALGRKVASPTGLRTNFYMVGVAGTSAGKDHARKCVKVLFQAAGLTDLLGGEELASGQAVLSRAAAHPVSLFQIDELGLMLKAVASKGAGPHLAGIMTNLIKLFSSAGTIYNGTEYADQKNRERMDIAYPCIGLHGTTTPETLWPALGSQDVLSGYLNRLLIMFVPDRRVPKRYVGITNPPAEIIEWLKAAREMAKGVQGIDPASPIEMSFGAMSEAVFTKFDNWVEDHMEDVKVKGLSPLWGRSSEHAQKIALGMACARYNAQELRDNAAAGSLEIDLTSAQWAVDFVRFVMLVQEDQVSTRMGDSDFDRQAQETLRIIRNASARGRTHAELAEASRMFRALEPRQQDAITDSLSRREAIQLVEYKPASGRGKSRKAWVASEFLPEQPESKEGEQP